jgi:hypothetical protein
MQINILGEKFRRVWNLALETLAVLLMLPVPVFGYSFNNGPWGLSSPAPVDATFTSSDGLHTAASPSTVTITVTNKGQTAGIHLFRNIAYSANESVIYTAGGIDTSNLTLNTSTLSYTVGNTASTGQITFTQSSNMFTETVPSSFPTGFQTQMDVDFSITGTDWTSPSSPFVVTLSFHN